MPYVGSRISVGVPTVVGVGEPDLDYPERWAITTWLDGTRPSTPSSDPRVNGTRLADGLVQFLTELRGIEVPESAKDDQALSWYRGLPLCDLDADFREAATECRELEIRLDIDEALRTWDRALAASEGVDPPVSWFHGDLLVENLLVDATGGLEAVIDFGGLALGNPTVDLAVAWEALDDAGRQIFRRGLDVEDSMWIASRGWALFIAMITFPYYGASMPTRCADRLAMAEAAIKGR